MSYRTTVLAALGALMIAPASTLAQDHSRTITITARSQLVATHLVDVSPAGLSPGDQLTFTERLLDRRGKRIGRDAAMCVRMFDQSSLCTGVYTFARGQIMVQLLQPGLTGTLTYDQAITGGTGRFAGARGTVTVAQSPAGDRFTFKIRVDR